MSVAQPTLVEQSVESTRKLAWYDDMIRHWSAAQWHIKCLLEAMNQQTRVDGAAAQQLHQTFTLSLNKLERLNAARQQHLSLHLALMDRVLDGEE